MIDWIKGMWCLTFHRQWWRIISDTGSPSKVTKKCKKCGTMWERYYV